MMDRFLAAAAGALASMISLPTTASAESAFQGVYAGVVAGAQVFSDNKDGDVDIKFDTGFVVGGLVGLRISDVRVEAEIDYQSTSAQADIVGAQNVDVDIYRYTAGVYYDIRALGLPVTPYAGGGVGVATINSSGGGNDATNFTWHGELGGSVAISPNLSIVPAYRYEWIDNSGLVSDDAITSHAFRFGVHWTF